MSVTIVCSLVHPLCAPDYSIGACENVSIGVPGDLIVKYLELSLLWLGFSPWLRKLCVLWAQ